MTATPRTTCRLSRTGAFAACGPYPCFPLVTYREHTPVATTPGTEARRGACAPWSAAENRETDQVIPHSSSARGRAEVSPSAARGIRARTVPVSRGSRGDASVTALRPVDLRGRPQNPRLTGPSVSEAEFLTACSPWAAPTARGEQPYSHQHGHGSGIWPGALLRSRWLAVAADRCPAACRRAGGEHRAGAASAGIEQARGDPPGMDGGVPWTNETWCARGCSATEPSRNPRCAPWPAGAGICCLTSSSRCSRAQRSSSPALSPPLRRILPGDRLRHGHRRGDRRRERLRPRHRDRPLSPGRRQYRTHRATVTG
ncbi:hypothetical protein SRIMM317S_04974 [Streptomyces rimosus subsp. rimosus]